MKGEGYKIIEEMQGGSVSHKRNKTLDNTPPAEKFDGQAKRIM